MSHRALTDEASGSAWLRACRPTVGGYLYPQHAGAPETVQHLEILGDGPDLAEAAVIVPADEPAVQLVALGLLTPEDALDHAPLPVLVLVKEPGRPASAGFSAVDGGCSLFDVGNHSYLEQHTAVVVGVVSPIRVKDGRAGGQPLPLHLVQHDRQHRDVVYAAGRDLRLQYDLQAQDGSYTAE